MVSIGRSDTSAPRCSWDGLLRLQGGGRPGPATAPPGRRGATRDGITDWPSVWPPPSVRLESRYCIQNAEARCTWRGGRWPQRDTQKAPAPRTRATTNRSNNIQIIKTTNRRSGATVFARCLKHAPLTLALAGYPVRGRHTTVYDSGLGRGRRARPRARARCLGRPHAGGLH